MHRMIEATDAQSSAWAQSELPGLGTMLSDGSECGLPRSKKTVKNASSSRYGRPRDRQIGIPTDCLRLRVARQWGADIQATGA